MTPQSPTHFLGDAIEPRLIGSHRLAQGARSISCQAASSRGHYIASMRTGTVGYNQITPNFVDALSSHLLLLLQHDRRNIAFIACFRVGLNNISMESNMTCASSRQVL
jgi:hypothetical protein